MEKNKNNLLSHVIFILYFLLIICYDYMLFFINILFFSKNVISSTQYIYKKLVHNKLYIIKLSK